MPNNTYIRMNHYVAVFHASPSNFMQTDKIHKELWETNVTLICHEVPGIDRQMYVIIREEHKFTFDIIIVWPVSYLKIFTKP